MSEEKQEVEVFGTKSVSVKEFMGSTDKSLMLLSDFDLAKENLLALKDKHEVRVDELVLVDKLSAAELKELNTIRAELREPRYLVQNIEKNNISVFEAYKKTDKANLKELIEVNKELEDKVSDKIKLENDRKELEKENERMAEQRREEKIKQHIDDIETYCYEVIAKMTFETLKDCAESVDKKLNPDFDFEEYDLLLDQVKERVSKNLLEKTNDITAREIQRQENEAMKIEIFDVRVNRLKEVGFDLHNGVFMREEESLNYQESIVLNASASEFESILSAIKNTIERKEQAKRDAEALVIRQEQEAKEKAEKDEQFEVRKNRFFEAGFNITNNLQFLFNKEFTEVSINTTKIFYASVTEFEQILSKAKQDVIDAENKVEQDEFDRLEVKKQEGIAQKKKEAEDKARVKRLKSDKGVLQTSVEMYFVDLKLDSENEETLKFVESANQKIKTLKEELLIEINNL